MAYGKLNVFTWALVSLTWRCQKSETTRPHFQVRPNLHGMLASSLQGKNPQELPVASKSEETGSFVSQKCWRSVMLLRTWHVCCRKKKEQSRVYKNFLCWGTCVPSDIFAVDHISSSQGGIKQCSTRQNQEIQNRETSALLPKIFLFVFFWLGLTKLTKKKVSVLRAKSC